MFIPLPHSLSVDSEGVIQGTLRWPLEPYGGTWDGDFYNGVRPVQVCYEGRCFGHIAAATLLLGENHEQVVEALFRLFPKRQGPDFEAWVQLKEHLGNRSLILKKEMNPLRLEFVLKDGRLPATGVCRDVAHLLESLGVETENTHKGLLILPEGMENLHAALRRVRSGGGG